MARTYIDALITEKSLSFVLNTSHDAFVDSALVNHPEVELPLKNVCAKVAPELSDEIDNIVGLLGISKRRFLEAAFVDAVASAKHIMDSEGVFGVVERISELKGGD